MHVRLLAPAPMLLLLHSVVLFGCAVEGPHPTVRGGQLTCSRPMERTWYRVTTLRVPTLEDVAAGALLGVDVDGIDDDVCDTPDYEGSVDNLLIEFAAAFAELTPEDPFDLNVGIEEGLFCERTNPDCAGVTYDVDIERCGDTARVQLWRSMRAASAISVGVDIVELDRGGRFDARFEELRLELPVVFQGEHITQEMNLFLAQISGVVSEDALNELVIGGALREEDVAPPFPCDPTLADCGVSFPPGLFDVMIDPQGASCDGVSAGFVVTTTKLNLDD